MQAGQANQYAKFKRSNAFKDPEAVMGEAFERGGRDDTHARIWKWCDSLVPLTRLAYSCFKSHADGV